MEETSRIIDSPVAAVWDVLADGWLYPLFVVGASRMREVDDDWPAPGSRLHHSVGSWPVLVDDTTEVMEVEPGSRIRLLARAWPSGEAEVEIVLDPQGDRTRVSIREDAARGPAILVPKPVRHGMLEWRNRETLRRLAYVAENRGSGTQ